MTVVDTRFSALSCYSAALAGYLAAEFADVDALLAGSMRVAVRTDLPDAELAFSHHRQPLDRLPDSTRLDYRAALSGTEALADIRAELAAHGRCLVVVDSAMTPWSPSYRGDQHAPHWLLVDGERAASWHVIDLFAGLTPAGEQRPYEGYLDSAELIHSMTPSVQFTTVQRRRNELAFGFPNTPPDAGLVSLWRRSDDGAGSRRATLPGSWVYDDEALRFLTDYFASHGAAAASYLDDVWAMARHQAFRCRWLGLVNAAEAWDALPSAVRFAVESARRGQPRESLLRRTFAQLPRLEPDRKEQR